MNKNRQSTVFIDRHLDEAGNIGMFSPNLARRNRTGGLWLLIFQLSTVVAIIALSALLFNIVNDSGGYTAFRYNNDPYKITGGVPLSDLTQEQLSQILHDNLTSNRIRALNNEEPIEVRSKANLSDLVLMEVIKPEVLETWSLTDSLFKRQEIVQTVVDEYPGAYLQFKMWLTGDFLTSAQSSNPLTSGIRTAILGALWVILITLVVSLPIGIGAAIYLEEYATQEKWYNRLIQTNINNLAAVPSIIYGILGLTIFVRIMAPFTSGAIFGLTDTVTSNGRTIISGGLTLALLVLPLIIINAQEAIRSVPNSLRQASFGLGATKWQTVWYHVLPNSIPGILTGTILAVSRAIGETAPLIVIGVATYITIDPTNIFSKFTTLPAQIYQWTARPQDEWRNLAAAAIIVLMTMLLALNAVAIVLRNKFSRKYT